MEKWKGLKSIGCVVNRYPLWNNISDMGEIFQFKTKKTSEQQMQLGFVLCASHDAFAVAYETHKPSTRNENFQCYSIRIAKQSRSSSPLSITCISWFCSHFVSLAVWISCFILTATLKQIEALVGEERKSKKIMSLWHIRKANKSLWSLDFCFRNHSIHR